MNFLALCNRLKLECGVSGADMVTLTNQSAEYMRLITWINAAWIDIQNTRPDWQWMRSTATFPTVTSQPTYTAAQIGLTDFSGTWARDTFRNYANPVVTLAAGTPGQLGLQAHNLAVGDIVIPFTTGTLLTPLIAGNSYYVQSILSADAVTLSATSGGAAIALSGTQSGTHTISSNNTVAFAGLRSEIFMPYLEYEWWRDGYEYGALRQTQSRPTEVTVTPAKALGVAPFPIAGYTVLGDYFRIPSEMAATTDIPALPTQFHMAIVYRAMMSYGAYEAAPEVYQRGETEFNRLMRRVLAHQMPEIRAGATLA